MRSLDERGRGVAVAVVDEQKLAAGGLSGDEVDKVLAVLAKPPLLIEQRNHEAETVCVA